MANGTAPTTSAGTARPEAQEPWVLWDYERRAWRLTVDGATVSDPAHAARFEFRDVEHLATRTTRFLRAVPLSQALESGPPVESEGTIRPVEVLPGDESEVDLSGLFRHVPNFRAAWKYTQERAHAIARAKGWHDTPREDGTMIALMHSELSEALEAMRRGNPASKKIPAFSHVEEELADVVIRIMDFAGLHGLDLGGAIEAKMAMNEGRSYRHGGKEF